MVRVKVYLLPLSVRGHVYASLEDKFQAISDFKQAAKLHQQQGENEDYQDALNRIRELQQ